MTIRPLEKRDITQVGAIVRKNYSAKYERLAIPELREMFRTGPLKPRYVVAEEKGKIFGVAGYIQSWMNYNVFQIFWVNVTPERQRQGIGKKLISRAIQQVKKNRQARLILLTTLFPRYYQKHWGFQKIAIFSKKKDNLLTLSLEK